MTYIKLEAHYTENIPGGVHVGAINWTRSMGGGLTVELPIPFVPIGEGLGISPAIETDGDTALRVDFTRWAPLRFGRSFVATFPFVLASQEQAVRVARAFENDPTIDWRDQTEDIRAWLANWMAANTAPTS